jgi:hypothetical protein
MTLHTEYATHINQTLTRLSTSFLALRTEKWARPKKGSQGSTIEDDDSLSVHAPSQNLLHSHCQWNKDVKVKYESKDGAGGSRASNTSKAKSINRNEWLSIYAFSAWKIFRKHAITLLDQCVTLVSRFFRTEHNLSNFDQHMQQTLIHELISGNLETVRFR